jgi:hypothetical protein
MRRSGQAGARRGGRDGAVLSGRPRTYVRRQVVVGAAWLGRRPAGIPQGISRVEDNARR